MNYTLKFRLSLGLSLAVILTGIVGGLFAFRSAYEEAHEAQDDQLRHIADLFDQDHLPAKNDSMTEPLTHSDEDSRFFIKLLSPPSSSPATVASDWVLPLDLKKGMHTIRVGDHAYRVWVKPLDNDFKLAVAQSTDVRDEIAQDDAQHALLPFLVLLPGLLIAIAFMVRSAFKPVAHLTREIDLRRDVDLHPIEEQGLPAEISPFIKAINHLLKRISDSMEIQQRFIAAAAHELRSPLAAMVIQSERLAQAPMSDVAQERLRTLVQGLERSRGLVEQLLTLARAQADSPLPAERVSVQRVFRRVLEDAWPLAEQKKIDIGLIDENDQTLEVSEADLTILIKNLVENSIRYTPEGGRIDLSVSRQDANCVIAVEDNGRGIPADEREPVLEPFYRMLDTGHLGSGLGLAIVKSLMDRWQGTLRLLDATQFDSGLRVELVFNAPRC